MEVSAFFVVVVYMFIGFMAFDLASRILSNMVNMF